MPMRTGREPNGREMNTGICILKFIVRYMRLSKLPASKVGELGRSLIQILAYKSYLNTEAIFCSHVEISEG